MGYGLSSLSNLQHLYLDLATNQFDKDGLSILLNSMDCLKLDHLTIILYSNSISNESLVRLTELLVNMNQLTHLNVDLRFSQINETGFNGFTRQLKEMKKLKSI